MENKKDIGKLFKAKLDGLEKSPNENLWAAINEELQEKKKKRRIIPFYFYYTGAALLLLFIGFATKSYWMPAFENFNTIENSQTTVEGNSQSTDANDHNGISNQQSNSNLKDGNSVDIKSKTDLNNNQTVLENTDAVFNNATENNVQNSSATNPQSNSGNVSNSKKDGQSISKLNSRNVSNADSKNNSKDTSKKSSKSKNSKATSINNNNAAVGTFGNNNNNSDNKINVNKDNITETESTLDKNSSRTEALVNTKTNSLEFDNEAVANFDAVTSEILKETDSLKVDSIAIKRRAKMELRLAAQNKLDSIEAAKEKYYVFAHAGVSAFNHFGKQSYIDPRLDNYNTGTELQYNYGIYFGFIANDKLNIRIGLNKASLGLITKNVPLISQNPNTAISGYFSNVDYNIALSNAQLANYFGASNVTLTQNIRFVEIPLEAKYKIYNGEIAIEAIGGISTLFLSKNEVKAEANDKFLYLGKVNNGRQASASLNLGAGFNYKIAKNLQINVEPIFKYYFRSFEVTNKPYSLNVQAGLQYNFSQFAKK